MKAFDQLTPQGQTRRLKQLAVEALKEYELDVSQIRLLCDDRNCLFRVDTWCGNRYALRICLPSDLDLDSLHAELLWLDALDTQTTLRVATPVRTSDGRLTFESTVAGVPGPRQCVLFTWLPGKDLADKTTPANWRRFGAYMAQLHAHGAIFRDPALDVLRRFDSPFPFPEPTVLLEAPYQQQLSPAMREATKQAITWVEESIEILQNDPQPMHLIHADLHHWNIKSYRDTIAALDFEDIMWGYPIQDIATTFYYMIEHPSCLSLYAAFRDGYNQHYPWPLPDHSTQEVDRLIDAFIADRVLVLLNYTIQSTVPKIQEQMPSILQRCERRLLRVLHEGIFANPS